MRSDRPGFSLAGSDAGVQAEREDGRFRCGRSCVDPIQPARGQSGRAVAAGRSEGLEVAGQGGGIPATRDAIERMSTGPDRRVGLAPPVRQVVPALVAAPCPVADLIATVAGLREASGRVLVHVRRAILVLAAPRSRPPAAGAIRRREMVASRSSQAFGHRVVE
jgi:hypothetical protein